jgi:hypothetical protein
MFGALHKGLLAVLILSTLPCMAQAPILYDNFDHKLINTSKWAYAFCFSSSGLEMECVREIRDEQLRLVHRHFGVQADDGGQQNGSAGVGFANAQNIKAIRTDVRVRSNVEVACAANPSFGSNTGLWGTFFNAGSRDPNDDVGAALNLKRVTSDPPGQLQVIGQTFHAGIYSPYTSLGWVAIGTPVTIALAWDQPNHQFVISLTNKITHVTTSATMPYTYSDTTPVAGPAKVMEAGGFASDCAANATSLYVDAVFDNVYIGR